jgi:hypothetical protein
MFSFSDPKSIPVLNLLHLVFKSIAPQRKIMWGFHCILKNSRDIKLHYESVLVVLLEVRNSTLGRKHDVGDGMVLF